MSKNADTGIYSEVKLSIAAEMASLSGSTANGKGLYISDATWKESANRKKGAVSGIAKTEEYNTALRQATTMAVLLANIAAERNNRSSNKAYSAGSTNTESAEFGTVENATDENALLKRIGEMTKIFDKDHFLFESEVFDKHIAPRSGSHAGIGTTKIAYNAITYKEVGDLIGNPSSSVTNNGITVKLYQGSGDRKFLGGEGGNLKIGITCSASDISSGKVLTDSALGSTKAYILGKSTKDANGYTRPSYRASVYMEDGTIYADGLDILGTITAKGAVTGKSFNATSDKRLKRNIKNAPTDEIISLVENTPIVMFNYKDSDERFIGILAQDVEYKNIEKFNLTDISRDGYLSVKEDKMIYILWEYVKYLKSEIEELKRVH